MTYHEKAETISFPSEEEAQKARRAVREHLGYKASFIQIPEEPFSYYTNMGVVTLLREQGLPFEIKGFGFGDMFRLGDLLGI